MSPTGFIGFMLSVTLLAVIGLGAYVGYRAQAQTALNPAPAAMVCAYSSSPPTVADGNFVLLQCDSTGKISVKP